MRAISQTYRPEFQNRLDKVIVFRPLTRELMRGILKKELAALARSARPEGPRLGDRVGSFGAGISAGKRLLAGNGRAAVETRDRPICRRAARRDHRGEALPRRRTISVRAQRRRGHPGRIRRSRCRRRGSRQDIRRRRARAGCVLRARRHHPGAARHAGGIRRAASRICRHRKDAGVRRMGGD